MDNGVGLVPIRDNAAGQALGGVSKSTVYNLIDRGELVRVNIGTRAFVTAESIKAYLDRITRAASASV